MQNESLNANPKSLSSPPSMHTISEFRSSNPLRRFHYRLSPPSILPKPLSPEAARTTGAVSEREGGRIRGAALCVSGLAVPQPLRVVSSQRSSASRLTSPARGFIAAIQQHRQTSRRGSLPPRRSRRPRESVVQFPVIVGPLGPLCVSLCAPQGRSPTTARGGALATCREPFDDRWPSERPAEARRGLLCPTPTPPPSTPANQCRHDPAEAGVAAGAARAHRGKVPVGRS